jgi:UDP-glucose 4-epimerase
MIAITGFSGFVGRHLLPLLDKEECLLLGRKAPSDDNNFCEFNLAAANKCDLINLLKPVCTLIHAAARVHVMSDRAIDPLAEFRAVNTIGTLQLAEQAAEAGVKRFIFLSSIKVNGESTTNQQPFSAHDNPMPVDPYGISKLEAEQQLVKLGKKTGMEIVIIRPPLVYGYGVKANFASLMKCVTKGVPLPLKAIKNNKRSLISVYNLADLIVECINNPNAANKIFLASDNHDISTAEMIALMAKVQGINNVAFSVPISTFLLIGKLFKKQDLVDRLTGSLQIDITHTTQTLNWHPPYSVEHGFKLAIKK